MSCGNKFTMKPKVRFCQTPTSISEEECCKYQQRTSSVSKKPQIRNIVTLKQPIKILPGDELKTRHLTDSLKSDKNATRAKHTSTSSSTHDVPSNACHFKEQNLSEKRDIGDDRSNVPNIKVGKEAHSSEKTLVETRERPDPRIQIDKLTGPTICNDRATGNSEILQNSKDAKKNDNYDKDKKLDERHNILNINPGSVSTKDKTNSTRNLKSYRNKPSVPGKTKISKPRTTVGTSRALGKKSVSVDNATPRVQDNASKKPITKVMPCLRSTRTEAKVASPTRKTILRNTTSCPVKAYVGPGMFRHKLDPLKPMGNEEPHVRPDIISGDKLGRPEYNSILHTIDKLREAREENIVTDVDHLPTVYRSLINGKISATLDFSPDEAIYKNLVDLTIDENQLPGRLTRSKDPEPRQRDVVPKISDFFTPKFADEYCTAVQIIPQSLEDAEMWSAFSVSDKVFGWKYDMDQGR